jgi:hypothetical protein
MPNFVQKGHVTATGPLQNEYLNAFGVFIRLDKTRSIVHTDFV